jgi:uncharacterized protein YbaP (TraB family)
MKTKKINTSQNSPRFDMLKYASLLPFFVLASITAVAQVASGITQASTQNTSSLLWKIEGKNNKKASYLFGTMHLIEKENFFFPEKLEKIVKKSSQLVMELAGMPDEQKALQYIQLNEGTFFDFFTEQQADSIVKWANNQLKMTEKQFRGVISTLKPFVLIQLATQLEFLGKSASYELTLEALAKKNSIPLVGLETVEQQIALFDELSREEQAQMVMETIREPEQNKQQLKKVQAVYISQNIDSLYLLFQQEGGFLAQQQASFVDNRNANWLPQIEKMIAQKQTFIAVGAGHLGGENGLIQLIKRAGYTVTPVKL